MDKELEEKIKIAEASEAYFITITTKEGNALSHWQKHTANFYHTDFIPSLEQLKKLIFEQYPQIKMLETTKRRYVTTPRQ